MEEKIEEFQEPWYRGPVKYILALLLILMLVLWFFPKYSIKLDPEPKTIPSVDDVVQDGFSVSHTNSSSMIAFLSPEDPFVKQTASKISGISCKGNRICIAKAMFYFVRDNFAYVNDPKSREYYQSTSEFLFTRAGDCDDHSITLANLLQANGFRTRFVYITGHVYVEVWLPEASSKYKEKDSDWVPLDPTCKTCRFGKLSIFSITSDRDYS